MANTGVHDWVRATASAETDVEDGDTAAVSDVVGPEPIAIRNRSLNGWLAIAWLTQTPTGVALAVAVASPVAVVVGLTMVVVSAWLAYRSWQAELRVDTTGVTIRNGFKTRHWRWVEVGEFGWDQPAWNIRGAHVRCVSVCPVGDPYTYPASTTACGLSKREKQRFQGYAEVLSPWAAARGVPLRTLDEEPAVSRWHVDPRARRE